MNDLFPALAGLNINACARFPVWKEKGRLLGGDCNCLFFFLDFPVFLLTNSAFIATVRAMRNNLSSCGMRAKRSHVLEVCFNRHNKPRNYLARLRSILYFGFREQKLMPNSRRYYILVRPELRATETVGFVWFPAHEFLRMAATRL